MNNNIPEFIAITASINEFSQKMREDADDTVNKLLSILEPLEEMAVAEVGETIDITASSIIGTLVIPEDDGTSGILSIDTDDTGSITFSYGGNTSVICVKQGDKYIKSSDGVGNLDLSQIYNKTTDCLDANLVISRVMQTVENGDTSAASINSACSDFFSRVDGVGLQIYSDFIQSANSGYAENIIETARTYISGATSAREGEDGYIHFEADKYATASYFGTFIPQVISTAGLVVGAIVGAINPLLGLAVSALSLIPSAISQAYNAGSNVMVDGDCTNNLFAHPVSQGTTAPLENDLTLKQGELYLISGASFSIYYWLSSANQVSWTCFVKMNGIPTDTYAGTSIDYVGVRTNSINQGFRIDSSSIFAMDIRSMSPAANSIFNENEIDTARFRQLLYRAAMDSSDNIHGNVNDYYSDEYARQAVCFSYLSALTELAYLTTGCGFYGDITNTRVSQLIRGAAGINLPSWSSITSDFDHLFTYAENLVEGIASGRYSRNINEYLYTRLYDLTLQLVAKGFPNRFLLYPPEAERGAYFWSAITIGLVGVAGIVGGRLALQRFRVRSARRIANRKKKVDALYGQFLATGSASDFNSYYAQANKYNKVLNRKHKSIASIGSGDFSTSDVLGGDGSSSIISSAANMLLLNRIKSLIR